LSYRSAYSYLLAALILFSAGISPAAASEKAYPPVRVGILHSLSGTMAISESVLKNVALMTIEQINASGGVLGRQIEPVVVDPASNWPLYPIKARELLVDYRVSAVFGCWTSVSRKAVLPVFEKYNGLLFYPLQYEGEEVSPNIFYTGATPNQQTLPAVEYLLSDAGGNIEQFYLLGTDYIYPRTVNNILHNLLSSKGIPKDRIIERYTLFGNRDYQEIVSEIRKFSKTGKTAVISTINGDSNIAFYNELASQDVSAEEVPVMAFSIGEEELRSLDSQAIQGHYAAWCYFMSLENDQNRIFRQHWADYAKRRLLAGYEKPLTTDPMEATYLGIMLWKQAVETAGSFGTKAVAEAMSGQQIMAPSGFTVTMDRQNHHLHRPVFIGKIRFDRQFDVVWQSQTALKPVPHNPHYKTIAN
jgi:urea transport system substrate-binding protein